MASTEPQDADLPKALLKRIVKAKLQEVDKTKGGDGTRDFQVNKDTLLAFGEAGKLFIHYLTAAANDICKDAKRQTISADDVISALGDLEFEEFVEPLKKSLEAFKAETKEKNKKKAEASKKRKSGPAEGADGAAAAAAGGEENQETAAGGEEGEAEGAEGEGEENAEAMEADDAPPS